MPAERFGEAALNLSQILEDAPGIEVLLVRLGMDALALVHVGAVEHAGLRGASQDHRALVLGLRRQVPRPRCGRPARSRRARPSRVDHLGRLRQRRVRTPPSRSGSRMPKVTTSSTTSVRAGHTCSARPFRRRWGSVVRALPAWRAATRTTPRPAAPAPRPAASSAVVGADPVRNHDLRAFRDFGNYVPATLVVEKQLEPSSDPGRFDLLVNGRVVVAAAGDGASRASGVRPGAYTVSEVAAAGTNPANYQSTVECKVGTRRTQVRSGSVYADLALGPDSWRFALSATSDSARPRSRSTRWGLPARQPETPCGISCSSAIRATFRSRRLPWKLWIPTATTRLR